MNNVQQNNPSEKPRFLEMDDVEDAILARWEDPGEDQASEDDEQEAPLVTEEETDGDLEVEELDDTELEDDEGDEDQSDEDTDQPDDDVEEVEVDDDFEVEVMVDGVAEAVSIGALKRLAGQEKSLTRKSQEVAAKRKEAEEAVNKSQVIFDKLIQQAEERYKPYQDIDMLVASRQMDTEDFAQLRKEAQQAKEDLDFLQSEADNYLGELAKQQQKALQEQAQECVKVLQEQIPEWSNELYNEIRSYAVQQGLPEEQVNTYVDPVVLQILHKSRLYDQGKQVATVKKKQAAKKKVLRSKKAPPNEASKRNANKAKMREKLRASKDVDDVADIILSRWAE